MKKRNLILAWWSNLWGWCPQCNSDAPDLYDCPVCKHDAGSPHKGEKKKDLWRKYKALRSEYYLIFCRNQGKEWYRLVEALNEDEAIKKLGNFYKQYNIKVYMEVYETIR